VSGGSAEARGIEPRRWGAKRVEPSGLIAARKAAAMQQPAGRAGYRCAAAVQASNEVASGPRSFFPRRITMTFSKLSLGLCALVFTALLAPLALSHASNPSVSTCAEPHLAPALAAGGDQVTTSQTGDLSLANSAGESQSMTGIKKDSDGNITDFTAGLTSYKWSPTEKVYNPTVIEMNYYKFKRLSPGRYSWEKCNANGTVLDSGSLDC
jgi:hypothetical protein